MGKFPSEKQIHQLKKFKKVVQMVSKDEEIQRLSGMEKQVRRMEKIRELMKRDIDVSDVQLSGIPGT